MMRLITHPSGLGYFQFPHLQPFAHVRHFISTRLGGYSLAPYTGLNLSLNMGDEAETVLRNRHLLAEVVEIPLQNMVFARQTHSANVRLVDRQEAGRGSLLYADGLADTDALITAEAGVCVVAMAADCVPILLYDTRQKAVAAVHAGWRGTVAQILRHTIAAMQQHFGTRPQDLWAGVGAHISVQHYEVGEELVQAVADSFGTTERYIAYDTQQQKTYFDLGYANIALLRDAGVPDAQIAHANLCTYHHAEWFFSARREGARSGRFVAGIMLGGN